MKLLIIFSIFFLQTIFSKSYSNEVYELEAKKVLYKNDNQIVIAEGNAYAKDNMGKEIFADKIIYNKILMQINTFGNSKFLKNNTSITANNFSYDLKTKIINADKNVIFTDKEENKFYFSKLKYNQLKEYGKGVNLKAYFKDGSYLDSTSAKIDQSQEIIHVDHGRYTTCSISNNKNFCPAWSLKSSEIKHYKKEKKVVHKNAFFRIKNIPVFYTPYISHPDPTVKRQRGFLPPSIKTLSNIGKTINVPYFIPIKDDKDLTITPVFYLDEHDLIKTSYRQALKNGFLNIESGYSKGYKKINKVKNRTKGSRNYLFVDYENNRKKILLEESIIKFKLQRVSQSNFLRVNKINTELFKEDVRTLENYFEITSSDASKFINIKAGVFENLDLPGSNKYTYYYPDGYFSYNTKIFNKYNTNYSSYFLNQKFNSDQAQSKIKNKINIDSNQKIFKKNGMTSQLKFNLTNNNIYNDNVTNLKNKTNIDNYATLALDTKYPLAKITKDKYQILSPRIFFKFTNGKMKNVINNEKILNYNDIFSMNRIDSDNPETGFSLGHGFDYKITKLDVSSNKNIFTTSFGIGQVLRDKAEKNLPIKSSLNNKSSDFAGYLKHSFYGKKNNFEKNINKLSYLSEFAQNKLTLKYDYNIDNNFKELNRNYFDVSGSYKTFYSSINFQEKANAVGSSRSSSITFKKLISDNYYMKIESKQNLKTNKYEYNKIGLNYENECITTSLLFSENFYFDKDVSASKSLLFSIILKPFADDISPDLTNFIN